MKLPDPPIRCYIGSVLNSEIDPYLEKEGFCHGLVIFSVPDLGIMFRCRAEGELIDLEFGAFFSLLKFLRTYLVKDAAKKLVICSSNPEFVLSFRPNSKHLSKGSTREQLLRDYTGEFELQVRYVEKVQNRCLYSPVGYPTLPEGRESSLKPNVKTDKRAEFRPFQRGIRL
jgi:hypothetical protein